MDKDIVDLYMSMGDFHKAVNASGLPTYVAYIKLLKSGVLRIQDKISYGSEGARLGGRAEELFQRLVPSAVDANRMFRKNNPMYDFMIEGLTVDVKYSSRHEHGSHWAFRFSGEQDMICAFLERTAGRRLDNPIILLIPSAFLKGKRLYMSEDSEYMDFEVSARDLDMVVRKYAAELAVCD